MAARKTYTVKPASGLNLRAKPKKDAEVIGVLPFGIRITVDPDRKAPEGWIAVDSVGFVQLEFLK